MTPHGIRTAASTTRVGEGTDIGVDMGRKSDFTCKLPFMFTGPIKKLTL